jgi:hypothetical protein
VNAAGDPIQTVQVMEDPASIAIRTQLAAAEDKQAASAALIAASGKNLVDALKPAPVTDAELWRGFFHTAAAGVLRHPQFAPLTLAADVADAMLAEYRKRYP